jgi:ABC-type sugar transport system permease subunit
MSSLVISPRSGLRLTRYLRRHAFATASVLPAVAFLVLFIALPMVLVVGVSLTNWLGIGPIQKIVGLKNYESVLGSGGYLAALQITLVYTGTLTVVSTTFGFVLAAMIHHRLRGWRFFKVSWFIPIMLPSVVIAILWSGGVFATSSGFLDSTSRVLGLPVPENGWLGDSFHGQIAIIVTAIWASTGWPMLILSAAMEKIPKEFFEAASIDGATWLERTRFITVPLMWPVISTVITLQVVFGLKAFDLVYVMTGGGPGTSTTTIGMLMWQKAIGNGNFAVGSAAAVLIIITIVPLTILQRRLTAVSR